MPSKSWFSRHKMPFNSVTNAVCLALCFALVRCDRYFMAEYLGSLTPMAIGRCTLSGSDLSTISGAMYQCTSDGEEVIETLYSDTDCSGEASSVTVYNSSSATFDCSGLSSFVVLDLKLDVLNGCYDLETQVALAIGVCYYDSITSTYSAIDLCDNDTWFGASYLDSECSNMTGTNDTFIIADECYNLGISVYIEALGGTYSLLTSVSECVLDFNSSATSLPTTGPTSNPVVSTSMAPETETTEFDMQTTSTTTMSPTQTPSEAPTQAPIPPAVGYYLGRATDGTIAPLPMNTCLFDMDQNSFVYNCSEDGMEVTEMYHVNSSTCEAETIYMYVWDLNNSIFDCEVETGYADLNISMDQIALECYHPDYAHTRVTTDLCYYDVDDEVYKKLSCNDTADSVDDYTMKKTEYADSMCLIETGFDVTGQCEPFAFWQSKRADFNIWDDVSLNVNYCVRVPEDEKDEISTSMAPYSSTSGSRASSSTTRTDDLITSTYDASDTEFESIESTQSPQPTQSMKSMDMETTAEETESGGDGVSSGKSKSNDDDELDAGTIGIIISASIVLVIIVGVLIYAKMQQEGKGNANTMTSINKSHQKATSGSVEMPVPTSTYVD